MSDKNFTIEECLVPLGVSDIAIITKKNKSEISQLLKQQGNTLEPCIEVSGTPIFYFNDVINWLDKNGISYDKTSLKKRYRKPLVRKLAFVGRRGVGKSRTVVKHIRHEMILRKIMSREGADATEVTHIYNVYRFATEDECYIKYNGQDSALNGERCNDLTEENITDFYQKITNENYYSKEAESKGLTGNRGLDNERDTIEIHTSASPLGLLLMGDDEDGLIIYDTPGLGDKIQGLNQVDADKYVLIMNNDSLGYIEKAINDMLPQLGGAEIVIIYRTSDSVDDEDDYEIMKERAHQAVKTFDSALKPLTENIPIIKKAIALLSDDKQIIPMAAFNPNSIKYAEKQFNNDYARVMCKLFSSNPFEYLESNIENEIYGKGADPIAVTDYITNIITKVIMELKIPKSGGNFRNTYINAGHYRTKHNDGYETINAKNETMLVLKNELYNTFSKLSIDEKFTSLNNLQQSILIQYCYKRIASALNFNCGISVGRHHLEANPPLTMWIEESTIADLIIRDSSANNISEDDYVNTMKQYFKSPTWDCVSIYRSYTGHLSYCNKKLEVLSRCRLFDIPAENTGQFVSNSYNLGLFMLGVYAVYEYIQSYGSLAGTALDSTVQIADLLHRT